MRTVSWPHGHVVCFSHRFRTYPSALVWSGVIISGSELATSLSKWPCFSNNLTSAFSWQRGSQFNTRTKTNEQHSPLRWLITVNQSAKRAKSWLQTNDGQRTKHRTLVRGICGREMHWALRMSGSFRKAYELCSQSPTPGGLHVTHFVLLPFG